MRPAWLLIALILQAAGGAPQTASISGRVTDKSSGRPLPRMVVTLAAADRRKPVEAITNADGRYQIADVPPGKYALGVEPDAHHTTYLRQWFGVDQPADAFTPPPPPNLDLIASESRTDVDVALTRALGIEGRVLDPFGEPLPGVTVIVVMPDGSTVPVPSSVSDDLGAYRIYGLRAGRYHVCVDVRSNGRFPWPSDKPLPPRTCYPSALSERDAADVSVSSQDAINVEVQMQGTGAAVPDATESTSGPASDTAGVVRGRVVDKETGRPIAHAIVRLMLRGDSQHVLNSSAVTADDGLYRFGGLPPGRYEGFAISPRHRSSPLLDESHSPDFTVAQRQIRETSVALARAYAIDVRLVDAFSDPISDVGVSVRSAEDGRPSGMGYGVVSDDRGHIRLHGLAPGRYVLCAEPPDYLASSQSATFTRRDRLLRTCYPSAVDEAEAQPVSIGAADVEDVELRMVRGRVLSISGTIVDLSGEPAAHASAALAKFDVSSERTRGFDVDAQGRFRLVNVLPGTYAIEATAGSGAAFVPIHLSDDVNGIIVGLRRSLNVRGRIIFDDPRAAPATAGDRPLRVVTRLAGDRLPGPASTQTALSNPDRTFLLENVFGRRTIDVVNVPSGWFVSAIRYGSKEVVDTPVDFTGAGETLDVVLSNRGASISGTISEIRDHRAERAVVFLFRAPVNKDDVPRFAGSVVTAAGSYRFAPLRDGDYLIVAVPADVPIPQNGQWDRMARLAAVAERVTLGALDDRTVELRIADVR